MLISEILLEKYSRLTDDLIAVTTRFNKGNYIFREDDLSTPFGKFLVRCLDTPITVSNDNLRNIGAKILKKYGIPEIKSIDPNIGRKNGRPDFSWDGNYLYTDRLDFEELFHEVAHWVIATKLDRNKKDFGLGTGFNSKIDHPADKPSDLQRADEVLAVILETCWIRASKGKWNIALDADGGVFSGVTIDYVKYIPTTEKLINWHSLKEDKFDMYSNAFNKLISLGLITKAGDPIWSVRITEDYVPDAIKDFLQKYEPKIAEKYECFGEGRHRRGWGNNHIVIKLPITYDGMAANEREYKKYKDQVDYEQKSKDREYLKRLGLTPADPDDEDITKYARCKLKYIDGIPVLIMEKLDPAKSWKDLPRWTSYIDSQQVGYDKKGKLKAYDFGENIDR